MRKIIHIASDAKVRDLSIIVICENFAYCSLKLWPKVDRWANLVLPPLASFATIVFLPKTYMEFLQKLPFANTRPFLYVSLLVRHYIEDNCTQKAASLTYTTLLSLVPIITVLLVILSSVPMLSGIREQVQGLIYENLLPQSGAQVAQYINDFAQKSMNMTLAGVGALFFTTIMTLITIETAFNEIWRVQQKSGGIKSVARYIVMVIATPIVLAVAFLASSAVQGISLLNRKVGGYGIDWTVWAQGISALAVMAGFAGLYWFIPKVKVPFKNALIAGIIIGLVFEGLKRVFGLAVSNFTSYEAVYGAFAALPIFLLWLYLSWNIILLGVEISYTLTIFTTRESHPRHPLFSTLDMVNVIYKNHARGKTTNEKELRAVLGRRELPKWNSYLSQLEEEHLIMRANDGNYQMQKDIGGLSLWHFYKKMPYPLPIKDELDELERAPNDPWCGDMLNRLEDIESHAKHALNVSLADVLDNTPVRNQAMMVDITKQGLKTTDGDDTDDEVIGDTATFDDNAKRMEDGDNNTIVVPMGEADVGQNNDKDILKNLPDAPPLGQTWRNVRELISQSGRANLAHSPYSETHPVHSAHSVNKLGDYESDPRVLELRAQRSRADKFAIKGARWLQQKLRTHAAIGYQDKPKSYTKIERKAQNKAQK